MNIFSIQRYLFRCAANTTCNRTVAATAFSLPQCCGLPMLFAGWGTSDALP